MDYVFTSESVTIGHPDKICDYISDLILDEALRQDSMSKMAVEVTIKDDLILIYGEQNTTANIDYETIAKNALKEIGYNEEYHVLLKVNRQSKEITNAVNPSDNMVAAGDQGIMFGFACNETDEYMPMPIYYAHKLAKKLEEVQRKNDLLGPDGKTQVSVEYENDKPKRIDSIVVSTQHSKEITQNEIKQIILKEVIENIIPSNLLDSETNIYINPSGSFVLGGSFGDSGTTGRKIVCDTYGGMGRIGGGCLSSKDPTKVDRSAAYYARYVAKNVVANGLAEKCEIQVSYAIGHQTPISIFIDTFNTEKVDRKTILDLVNRKFDFSVANIIRELDLRKPIYANTSCYGHFGKPEFLWEKVIQL